MKKIAILLCLLLCLSLVGKGWYLAKRGFSPRRLDGHFAIMSPSVLPPSEVLQEYTYLGHGRQFYAFESADGRYVLKLPRMDRYRVSVWRRLFPSLSSRQYTARERRKKRLLESLSLAEKELKDGTGIVYSHLGLTSDLHLEIFLSDPLGRRFPLDLDRHSFVVQKKALLWVDAFLPLLHKGDIPQAKALLESYLKLLLFRAQQGIWDKDPTFVDNLGWDGTQAVYVDVGTFYRKEGMAQSFRESTSRIRSWIADYSPELGEWCKKWEEEILE